MHLNQPGSFPVSVVPAVGSALSALPGCHVKMFGWTAAGNISSHCQVGSSCSSAAISAAVAGVTHTVIATACADVPRPPQRRGLSIDAAGGGRCREACQAEDQAPRLPAAHATAAGHRSKGILRQRGRTDSERARAAAPRGERAQPLCYLPLSTCTRGIACGDTGCGRQKHVLYVCCRCCKHSHCLLQAAPLSPHKVAAPSAPLGPPSAAAPIAPEPGSPLLISTPAHAPTAAQPASPAAISPSAQGTAEQPTSPAVISPTAQAPTEQPASFAVASPSEEAAAARPASPAVISPSAEAVAEPLVSPAAISPPADSAPQQPDDNIPRPTLRRQRSNLSRRPRLRLKAPGAEDAAAAEAPETLAEAADAAAAAVAAATEVAAAAEAPVTVEAEVLPKAAEHAAAPEAEVAVPPEAEVELAVAVPVDAEEAAALQLWEDDTNVEEPSDETDEQVRFFGLVFSDSQSYMCYMQLLLA